MFGGAADCIHMPGFPYGRCQVLADNLLFLSVPKPGHQENSPTQPHFAKRYAFVRCRDTEPLRSFGFKCQCASLSAVTVGVGLHYRAHSHGLSDMLLYGAEVLPQGRERNIGPGWARRRAAEDFCCGSHLPRLYRE